MINVANLSFSYSSNNTIVFPSFSLNQGEHCLLLGSSGSGKTTLLHLLGGLLRGYSGNIQLDNAELSAFSESQLDSFRGRNIGFIFQKNHLISALNVEKNLAMASYLAGNEVDNEHTNDVLAELNLAEKRKSSVLEISHGQAQRVAIARAVMNNPKIILADEPTSALDDHNCERVINLLLELASRHKSTLVVATHDQRLKSKIAKHILL
ncbi:MAG TPA: ATP-binding cassette domain-containing protein [Cyclobacteriaceae bacterium]|nr:ATP-binding cassette domain-containing protein [Cyclobacteriaceae bacterium]